MNKIIHILRITFRAVLAALILIPVADSGAVMPPAHYEEQAKRSNIKAIAVVKAVRILSKTDRSTHKQVVFSLVRSLGTESPPVFYGTCYSVDESGKHPGVDGTIYYYPVNELRVLVTILDNNGPITSLTVLTDELKAQLERNGLKNIRFFMGKARIVEPDQIGE